MSQTPTGSDDNAQDSGTGIVKEKTYSGHKIQVARLKAEECELVSGVSSGDGPDSGTASPTATEYHYEFEAYVDGEPVTVAGEIETRGYEKPWIPALVQYVEAYIDGMHDGAERGNPYVAKWPDEHFDSFQG